MPRAEAMLRRVEDLLHALGCTALVVVAVLINADIISRVVGLRPLEMQFELTELYLMPSLATLSLARVFRDGGHLALEVDTPSLLGPLWPVVRRLVLAASAAFFLTVAYVSGRHAVEAFAKGSIEFGVIDWPLGWAYLPVPVGTGLLAVRLLVELVKRGAPSALATNTGGDINEI
ncbi:TRAP transporter small permease [Acuticoccus sediminis]|uniref:TRAP transporter small permease protein n=1 Tax=Acuticoccus sediminis TaxID=2184697 RepID=A0A8B2NRB1_9HYPH|nr:TRAP transporter small permease [Acuticoccus sediminis]RAI02425.1 TRAP transporter small permease [Acuticoccus sediminis]